MGKSAKKKSYLNEKGRKWYNLVASVSQNWFRWRSSAANSIKWCKFVYMQFAEYLIRGKKDPPTLHEAAHVSRLTIQIKTCHCKTIATLFLGSSYIILICTIIVVNVILLLLFLFVCPIISTNGHLGEMRWTEFQSWEPLEFREEQVLTMIFLFSAFVQIY